MAQAKPHITAQPIIKVMIVLMCRTGGGGQEMREARLTIMANIASCYSCELDCLIILQAFVGIDVSVFICTLT